MNVYVKTGSAGLILVICVAVISYSPLFGTFYEDWKKGRELDRVEALLEENSEVRKFTIDGGAVFASSLNIQLKVLSESLVGFKVVLSPSYPYPPEISSAPPYYQKSNGYKFTIHLEDRDGFGVEDIEVFESEMTGSLDDEGVIYARFYEGNLSLPLEDYVRFRGVDITYKAPASRREAYNELRSRSPKDIVDERNTQTRELIEDQIRLREAEEAERQNQLAAQKLIREEEFAKLAKERKRQMLERSVIKEAEETRKVELKIAWSQLNRGLSVNKVHSLLGQPDRTFTWTGLGTTYYYGRGGGVR